jgi:microcystin-dependent protein
MASRDFFQQAFSYRDANDSNRVKPLDALQVTVKVAATPPGGGANAVIYGSRSTADVTPLPNPMVLGADGLCEFWAPIADYDITIHDTVAPARVADKTFGWTASPSLHASTHESGGADSLPSILALPPIGAQIPYAGVGDPNASWLLCDGRLLDSAAYPALDAMIGAAASTLHVYNGGVSPGAGKFKIPDKRGRGSVGSINMGSAQAAGPGDTTRVQAVRGVGGGTTAETLTIAQIPQHHHLLADTNGNQAFVAYAGGGNTGNTGNAPATGYNNGFLRAGAVATTAGAAATVGGSHNNISPYDADSWIIRVK